MNNPLLRACGVVFVTWWIVLSFLALRDTSHLTTDFLSVALYKATIVGISVLVGLAYPVAYLFRRRRLRLELLAGTTRRGLQITLGPIPKGLLPPDRIPGSTFTPDEDHALRTWIEFIREHRPDIYAVFSALTDIYAANLALPASPVPFGHGGRTLFEHTMVVVDMIISKSQIYSFEGSYSKSGKKISGLNDPHYTFDRSDPLIPLIGYAHDIGKIEAYRLLSDGRVKEVLPDHDRPGRLLLARLDEVWELPKEDREALMNAVGYYHHPHALPRHVEDRSRALMELLLEADLAAGEWEGKNPLSPAARSASGSQPSTCGMGIEVPPAPEAWLPAGKGPTPPAPSASPSPIVDSVRTQTAPVSSASTALPVEAANLTEHEQNLVHQLIGVLAMPDSINGKRRQFRIGYKYEGFVYLKEASLCKAIAEALGEPKLASPATRKGDNRSPLTEDIMRSLDKLGLLMIEHDGRTYSFKTAIFVVDWYDARAFRPDPPKSVNELLLETDPATVILRIKGPLSHLAKLPDCRLVPKIVRPLMGTHKAINKPKGGALEHAESLPEAPTDELVDKEPETKVDSDGKVPPITKELEIDPPVAFVSDVQISATKPGSDDVDRIPTRSTDLPESSPRRTGSSSSHSGLKRRPPSTSFSADVGETDVLTSILNLQAAAEARAAAKAKAPPPPTVPAAQNPESPGDRRSHEPEPSNVQLAVCNDAPATPTTIRPDEPASSGSADPVGISERASSDAAQPAGGTDSAAVHQVREAIHSLGLVTHEQTNAKGVVYVLCPITPELSERVADLIREIAVRPRKDVKVIADRKTGTNYLAYEKVP